MCGEDSLIPQGDRDVVALQMFITVSPSVCLHQSAVIAEGREDWLFRSFLTTLRF